MDKKTREFQVFAKPIGSLCNLDCHYCYYLKKEFLYPRGESFRMPESLLEEYIKQHIVAASGPVIDFFWHGGEPTLLGLDYFRKIVELQRRHQPYHQRIANNMQTNGTLLDEEWCRFLAAEDFRVGLSMDGPRMFHDRHRITKIQNSTFKEVMRGYRLLRQFHVPCDLLCVVHAANVQHPLEVYRFFKQIHAQYLSFLPLVEPQPGAAGGVSFRTVPAEAFGNFLCAIFDEWKSQDIGRIKVQIFEEMARAAIGQEHALCIFRETCGDVPVIEHNGDFFSCDHFVDREHRVGNIQEIPFAELLESPHQRSFGRVKTEMLPRKCRACEFLRMCNGGCPKDRILRTGEGEAGLNYLCAGYKRFFAHSQPFAVELSALWRRESLDLPMEGTQANNGQTRPKTGRNDPCPCGSGRKYKKCCLGK